MKFIIIFLRAKTSRNSLFAQGSAKKSIFVQKSTQINLEKLYVYSNVPRKFWAASVPQCRIINNFLCHKVWEKVAATVVDVSEFRVSN